MHDVKRVRETAQLLGHDAALDDVERLGEQFRAEILLPLVELSPDVRRDEVDARLVVGAGHDHVREFGRWLVKE